MTTAPFDLAQTDRLLTTTRSVRKRLDLTRPVPRDVLLECIDVASQAPSGGNSQPWRWLIVDDAEKKAQVAELYRKAHDPYLANNRALAEQAGRLEAMQKVMDSSAYLSDHMHEVPAMVIPCLLSRTEGASAADVAGFYGSILPAAWSFMLALRSRGLGSAWTTLHLNYEQDVGDILGIPATVTQALLLPVAYYTGDDFKPAPRRPAEEIVYFNGWKQR